MTYFNTTNAVGADLRDYQRKAKSQEELILSFFRKNAGDWSPSQVLRRVFDGRVPLTSVRRAMTNLTNAGDLCKTDRKRRGDFGRPEYLWELPGPSARQPDLFA